MCSKAWDSSSVTCTVCVVRRVGSGGDIQLNGEFILEQHCSFVNEKGRYTHTHALIVLHLFS